MMTTTTVIQMYLAIGLPIIAVVLALSYWKFKWGIGTRLYGIISAIGLTCGVSGVIIGMNMSWRFLAIVEVIIVPPLAALVYVLYRLVVVSIQGQIVRLVASSNQISSAAKQAASTASEQAAVVAQVSTTISEINQTSRAASSVSQQVLKKATRAADQGRRGEEAVAEAARILELVAEAAEVVETVGDLAEQSNLLAVNASIEAAKAGDRGRGFSVVASEVRNLAEQSKIATQQIRAAIKKVEEGKRSIDTTMMIIRQLSIALEESSDAARQISGAANEQAAGIGQIHESMSNVAQGGKDTAAAAQSLESALSEINGISAGLHKLATGHELVVGV